MSPLIHVGQKEIIFRRLAMPAEEERAIELTMFNAEKRKAGLFGMAFRPLLDTQ